MQMLALTTLLLTVVSSMGCEGTLRRINDGRLWYSWDGHGVMILSQNLILIARAQ